MVKKERKEETVSRLGVSDSLQPMDFSPPASSVHGILQTRILEWVAIPFSRGSSQPRDQTWVSHIADRFFVIWATREDVAGKICLQCRKPGFDPWVGKIPWKREWQPTQVLPGESHGQKAWQATVFGSQRVGHDWKTNTLLYSHNHNQSSDYNLYPKELSHIFHLYSQYTPNKTPGNSSSFVSFYIIIAFSFPKCQIKEIMPYIIY